MALIYPRSIHRFPLSSSDYSPRKWKCSVPAFWEWRHFCRAMLCISAAYAVMQCLSVCLSRSWITWKRIKVSSKFFHHWVANPF